MNLNFLKLLSKPAIVDSRYRKVALLTRGCSGSGKSTFAEFFKYIDSEAVLCSADDYMIDKDGNYNFSPQKLGYCHNQCRNKYLEAVRSGKELVVVHNTNVKESDFAFYIDNANLHGYTVFSIVVENRHGKKDVHGLNQETLQRQENNIKNSLKLR